MSYLTVSEIAERVRSRVDEKGLTQNEIAGWVEVSQPVVSEALKGHPNQRQTLFRIARHMGFEVESEPLYRFEEVGET